jgi:hypothetical protein
MAIAWFRCLRRIYALGHLPDCAGGSGSAGTGRRGPGRHVRRDPLVALPPTIDRRRSRLRRLRRSTSDRSAARCRARDLRGFGGHDGREVNSDGAESAHIDGDRNARTLVKARAFRPVLLAFCTGAAFDENDQRGTLALRMLEGPLALRAGQDAMDVGEGDAPPVTAHDYRDSARDSRSGHSARRELHVKQVL